MNNNKVNIPVIPNFNFNNFHKNSTYNEALDNFSKQKLGDFSHNHSVHNIKKLIDKYFKNQTENGVKIIYPHKIAKVVFNLLQIFVPLDAWDYIKPFRLRKIIFYHIKYIYSDKNFIIPNYIWNKCRDYNMQRNLYAPFWQHFWIRIICDYIPNFILKKYFFTIIEQRFVPNNCKTDFSLNYRTYFFRKTSNNSSILAHNSFLIHQKRIKMLPDRQKLHKIQNYILHRQILLPKYSFCKARSLVKITSYRTILKHIRTSINSPPRLSHIPGTSHNAITLKCLLALLKYMFTDYLNHRQNTFYIFKKLLVKYVTSYRDFHKHWFPFISNLTSSCDLSDISNNEKCYSNIPLYMFKCDMEQCFDNINQTILFDLLNKVLVEPWSGLTIYCVPYTLKRYINTSSISSLNNHKKSVVRRRLQKYFFFPSSLLSVWQAELINTVKRNNSMTTNNYEIDLHANSKRKMVPFPIDWMNVKSMLHTYIFCSIIQIQAHAQSKKLKCRLPFPTTLKSYDLYQLKCGIPQGGVLSSFLCDFYYTMIDHTIIDYINEYLLLSKTYKNTTENATQLLYCRHMDDYLCFSPDRHICLCVLNIFLQANETLGFKVKPTKLQHNLALSSKINSESEILSTTSYLTWCGISIMTQYPYAITISRARKIIFTDIFKFNYASSMSENGGEIQYQIKMELLEKYFNSLSNQITRYLQGSLNEAMLFTIETQYQLLSDSKPNYLLYLNLASIYDIFSICALKFCNNFYFYDRAMKQKISIYLNLIMQKLVEIVGKRIANSWEICHGLYMSTDKDISYITLICVWAFASIYKAKKCPLRHTVMNDLNTQISHLKKCLE